jgi:hypothetical protein
MLTVFTLIIIIMITVQLASWLGVTVVQYSKTRGKAYQRLVTDMFNSLNMIDIFKFIKYLPAMHDSMQTQHSHSIT